MDRLARVIAGFFGCGHVPLAPGTAGSAAAALIGAALLAVGWPALLLGAALAVMAGTWAVARAGAAHDPGWVVIDEVAGQWIAMLALGHPSWRGILLAFVLFRLFDIAKPGPVGWADRRSGPAAVMLDDVIAGLLAAGVLFIGRRTGILD